ncbi:ZIP family metal transporter [Aeromicrobium sp. Root495]|uniref:ZIP family metal transporter n=1 Tax=Aeromicrobium sp. Root495 TaxID=1736550 RepID=UPI0006F2468D|nr:hypothetical protein [Aeromicrobium sp. Root495]KQY58173.1 ZIP family metal transporter [Aeromicrobium sp. Root495]RYJ07650.1 MAG: ZIP family metal transporter [Actinomycetales bacterium]
MVLALAYGLATAVPLVGGAAIGLRWKLPQEVLAALMAFGAGTMVAAAGEELFGPAFEALPHLEAGGALLLGAGVYVTANHWLDRRAAGGAVGLGLLLGAVLDGVPENAALGVSLSDGGLALLVAIAVGNMPEAIGSASTLRDDPSMGARKGLLLWTVTGTVLVVVTVVAHAAADVVSPDAIALTQAFAGGATIAVLADTLMPEAYRDGGWWVGLATAAGFLAAYLLG